MTTTTGLNDDLMILADEQQQMEAEALAAIFDTHFTICDDSSNSIHNNDNHHHQTTKPRQWSITIYPETTGSDPSTEESGGTATTTTTTTTNNHVACQCTVTLPRDYPDNESSIPSFTIEIIKGLAPEHAIQLQHIAEQEAIHNAGTPSIFAVVERLREWLVEHNVKGLDDVSMHAQMIRKQLEQEKQKQAAAVAATAFESQKKTDEMTEAELEELQVRKRRAEGTPCTKENFLVWKARFDAEMAMVHEVSEDDRTIPESTTGTTPTTTTTGISKKKTISSDAATLATPTGSGERMTGFQFFSSKAANLDALEAAAEEAGKVTNDEEEGLDDVDEDLFDEDVDLDDLDFDDDEDDDELDGDDVDDEEEELDI